MPSGVCRDSAMKIWLLMSRLQHGGLERVQLNIASALHARGIDVALVSGQVHAATRHELPEAIRVLEIAKAGPAHFTIGLLRALLRERPDIVFTTSNDIACLTLALRRVAFRSMRVVVTQHLSISGPRLAARGIKRGKLEAIRTSMRLLVPHADRIVAVSHGVADDMRRELSLPCACIEVIHNPIVTSEFDERMKEDAVWPWPDRDVPTIIFVGRLSLEKRLDLLLESFQNLLRSRSARLLIVGTGSEQQKIERRVHADGLQSCCKFTGFVQNALPLIHASDVLVLPSDYEGFGNVLVEAMACGTQVIATNCPSGPAEILGEGDFGQLIPVGDRSALEAAMRRCLDGSFRVPPAVLRARAGEFSIELAADRYLALLCKP